MRVLVSPGAVVLLVVGGGGCSSVAAMVAAAAQPAGAVCSSSAAGSGVRRAFFLSGEPGADAASDIGADEAAGAAADMCCAALLCCVVLPMLQRRRVPSRRLRTRVDAGDDRPLSLARSWDRWNAIGAGESIDWTTRVRPCGCVWVLVACQLYVHRLDGWIRCQIARERTQHDAIKSRPLASRRRPSARRDAFVVVVAPSSEPRNRASKQAIPHDLGFIVSSKSIGPLTVFMNTRIHKDRPTPPIL